MTTQPGAVFLESDRLHDGWTKLPHALIDRLPLITTTAELKVILYVLRHTWGFQDYEGGRRMTLDEFAHGRKRRDGSRMDGGTGLSRNAIKAGVRAAVAHGFLIRESDGRDGGRSSYIYRLRTRTDTVPRADTLSRSRG